MDKMRCGPFDESICIIGNRGRWRTLDVLKNRVEQRSNASGQIGHELAEFAVEITKKQEGLVAQHRKARVVNRADRILRLEESRHQWWKPFRNRLCVHRRFQREAEGKVALAHRAISFLSAPAWDWQRGCCHLSGPRC